MSLGHHLLLSCVHFGLAFMAFVHEDSQEPLLQRMHQERHLGGWLSGWGGPGGLAAGQQLLACSPFSPTPLGFPSGSP